jgi:hypothetical protein
MSFSFFTDSPGVPLAVPRPVSLTSSTDDAPIPAVTPPWMKAGAEDALIVLAFIVGTILVLLVKRMLHK